MDIEQLKDLWKEDASERLPEINLESQKLFSTPLQKIRKNMKMEFLSSIFILPLVIWGIYKYISQPITQFYALMLLGVGYLVVGYYYFKFYQLYNKLNYLETKTLHSLLRLKYDLSLNVQMYKSYYLAFIPILFCELILVFQDVNSTVGFETKYLIVNFLFWFLVSGLMLYFSGKAWLYYFYEKYIIQVSKLADDLSDEVIPEGKRNTYMDSTYRYLNRYCSETLAFLWNVFLWFCLSLLLLFVLFKLSLIAVGL